MYSKNQIWGAQSTRSRISDTPLITLVGYHLKRASDTFQAELRDTLEPFGLRMLSYYTLAMIHENSGLNQTQLARLLDIERPNLVAIIDLLENRKLIRREQVQEDRRAYALNITNAGRKLFDQVQTAVYAHEHRLLEGVDAKLLPELIKALRTIETNASKRKIKGSQ